ncbi:MAG TPA: right-handed parallel beta-helix repeat-containing protein, partial [Candidatus Dormibacteraeota bacterium]|nr:right-handed parallel beta-helix repeat-containing protein [Candidatus Dormibacteraeota bacterium]
MGRKRLPRGWLSAVLAFMIFAGLAAVPFALHSNSTPPWVRSALGTSPVPISTTQPQNVLPGVHLSSVASPVDPSLAPAGPPSGDLSREASLVAGEDLRLRTLLHHLSRLSYPIVVPVGAEYDVAAGVTRAGTPTLVLPGPATYTIDDLLANQAVIPLSQGGYMLEDNVLVGSGATLKLSSAEVPILLMDSSDSGFTSLVTWGGTISLSGTGEGNPLIIEGWNKIANAPAVDHGYGRPYIRAVGGELDLKFVRASYLGFWSGRTGGVAWTGISSHASTGSAVSSRFMYNAYGAFVSRAQAVKFSDDLFEGNMLDGLRLHRLAVGSVVDHSAAARNAGNGFVVSRGATGNLLQDDLSVNNAGNGFLLDGLALVHGASPSGDKAVASQGTIIELSDAEANARTGILVEGGTGTIVRNNIVCGPITGIAVRVGADQTYIVGNDVRCAGRVALSVGPSVTATTINANTFSGARIGVVIRNAPGVRIFDNRINDVSVFGISVRGNSPGVVGNSNTIAGRGFQPIDTRGGASTPTFQDTNLTGWQHRSSLNFVESLRYHPLLTAWVVILLLVGLFWIISRLRRRPA